MKTKIEKQPKSTIKLTVTIPQEKVAQSYDKILEEAVKETTIEGFRKGNAPKEMVKEKIGVSAIYGEVINDLLQTYYPQALKENAIVPISNPKVELKEFEMEKDFTFTAEVAVRPEVKVKEYKKKLEKKLEDKEKLLKKDIEEKKKTGEEVKMDHVHMGTNDVLEVLLENSEVELSDILLDEETERMLGRLHQQLQQLGMDFDQYAKSQNKSEDDIKNEYKDMAYKNLKAEFVLAKLVEDENIEVTDEEIEEMMSAMGDPAALKRLQENPMEKYYIKSILQKNKLLSKLIEITEGDKHHVHE